MQTMTGGTINSSPLSRLGAMRLSYWVKPLQLAGGAAPVIPAKPPTVLPRWDDISVAVLRLAHQLNMLSYCPKNPSIAPSRKGGFVVSALGAPPPPAANIRAAHDLGAAYASSGVRTVLKALNLVSQGAWTASAETVHWRQPPPEWSLRYASDPRVLRAAEVALETMPADIESRI